MMKKIVIGSVIAAAVLAFSGCTYKSSCNTPKLPKCVSTCAPAPCPTK